MSLLSPPARRLRGAALRLGLLLLASACSPQAETSGTNTNWLRRCQNDAECGEQGQCLCGRCTLACDSTAACGDEALVCTEDVASVVQCQGQPTRTCQPACSSDRDCGDRHCLAGACVDPLSDSCPDGALYCEDFERDFVDPTLVVTSGNELAREPTAAPSGAFALRATIGDGPSVAYLRAPLSAPLTSGTVFLSGWVRVPDIAAHNVAPLALWSADEEDWALRLVLQDARLDVWSKTTPMTSSQQLVNGEWYCLELEVGIGDATAGHVVVSVNGDEVARASEVDTLPGGGIQAVTSGALWANSEVEVLVDRVILSRDHVPCF
jgi:hypothetical protein